MVLSTAHLPRDEFDRLIDDEDMCFRFVDHEYGVILVLMNNEACLADGSAEETFSKFPHLKDIIEYAWSNEIRYIDFDRDGDCYPDYFEVFNWI